MFNVRLIFLFLFAASSLASGQSSNTQKRQDAIDALSATMRMFDGNESSTCFLVAKEAPNQFWLVTAKHAFEGTKSKDVKLVVRSKDADGNLTRKEVALQVRDESGKPRWRSHPNTAIDVGVLDVGLSEDIQVSAFAIDQLLPAEAAGTESFDVGSECIIPCFPATLESTDFGYGVLRKGDVASYPIGPTDQQSTFLLDYSSFGGDSGAPVLSRIDQEQGDSKLFIVGLVFAKQQQTDRTVSPTEETIRHTPLGLGIAVHARYILETIQSK